MRNQYKILAEKYSLVTEDNSGDLESGLQHFISNQDQKEEALRKIEQREWELYPDKIEFETGSPAVKVPGSDVPYFIFVNFDYRMEAVDHRQRGPNSPGEDYIVHMPSDVLEIVAFQPETPDEYIDNKSLETSSFITNPVIIKELKKVALQIMREWAEKNVKGYWD